MPSIFYLLSFICLFKVTFIYSFPMGISYLNFICSGKCYLVHVFFYISMNFSSFKTIIKLLKITHGVESMNPRVRNVDK